MKGCGKKDKLTVCRRVEAQAQDSHVRRRCGAPNAQSNFNVIRNTNGVHELNERWARIHGIRDVVAVTDAMRRR